MSENHYLLDNNVLGKLTHAERAGAFVRARCRITADVLREAEGYPDIETLRRLEYPTTRPILKLIQYVMGSVPPGDFRLVHLYANKGAADPGLIACALHASAQSEDTLFAEKWHIVTDDKGVRSKAAEFAVPTLGSSGFLDLVRQSTQTA